MSAANRRRRHGLDIWPGFVDALATLVMVIVFVLMMFTLFQFHLKDVISDRDNSLDQLSRQIARLADQLAIEQRNASDLRDQLGLLTDELSESITTRERLQSELATAEGRSREVEGRLENAFKTIAADKEKIDAQLRELDAMRRNVETLTILRDQLERDVGDRIAEIRQLQRLAEEERRRAAAALAAEQQRGAAALEEERRRAAAQAAEQQSGISALQAALEQERRRAAAVLEEERRKSAAQLDEERRRLLAAIEAERARAAGIEEARRLAQTQVAAERERVTALDEERRRALAAIEAERARVAGLDEQRRRGIAELEAERARIAALDEQRRRSVAELEAERARIAGLDEERRRALAAAEAERARVGVADELRRRGIAELEAERSRVAGALEQERRLSADAQARVDLLTRQINTLQQQLARLESALEVSETKARDQQVQIVDLGRRLNLALASKVEELARYRSEFFGRLREALGENSAIRIVGDRFIFDAEVLFESGSPNLEAGGRQQIQRVAQTLREISQRIPADLGWVLQVDGHTDKRPVVRTFASNWELSTARAMSVVRALMADGVPPDRLSAAGFAEFQPIDPRDDEAAYRRNRRIELKLTNR
jgi:chemotaxis protein MotB